MGEGRVPNANASIVTIVKKQSKCEHVNGGEGMSKIRDLMRTFFRLALTGEFKFVLLNS